MGAGAGTIGGSSIITGAGAGVGGATGTMISACGGANSVAGGVTGGVTDWVTDGATGGAIRFTGVDADFAATLVFALTGLSDSLLWLLPCPARGIEFASSDFVIDFSGSVIGLSLAVMDAAGTGTLLAAETAAAEGTLGSGAVIAVSVFAALLSEYLFTPIAMPAPAAITSAAIKTGRIELAEKLPEVA